MEQKSFNLSEVFNSAWALTKKHGIIVGLFILVISIGLQVIASALAPTPIDFDPNDIKTAEDVMKLLPALSESNTASTITSFIQTILTAGVINMVFGLTLGRIKEANLSVFKMPLQKYLSYFAVSFIVSIITVVGTLFCVIPGIYLGVRLQYAQYHILEHTEDGIIGAIKKSWELTKTDFFNHFLLGLASFGIIILGFICCCIGAYFAMAFVYFAYVIAYLTLMGYNPTESAPQVETTDAPRIENNETASTEENGYNKTY